MLEIRRADERGRSELDWLSSAHTFSFAEYHDPKHMGFRSLRVINEDHVAAGTGFGKHPHRDMEILTWVLAGALRHEDSLGTGSVIRPGDIQRMTAGTGVIHSEWNASTTDPVHLLQIWILPAQRNLAPSYEERRFEVADRHNRLRLVASKDAREGSVRIHQDASLYVGSLDAGVSVSHELRPGTGAWLQIARGRVRIGGVTLAAGDAAATDDDTKLSIEALEPSEVLLFELA
jgi:redox-sensitive bicupin YhaK (pirin superfamily)